MPKIKINVRFAVILAVSGIVFVIAVLLVHAFQKNRQADDKLIRARRYAQRLNEEKMEAEAHRDLAVDAHRAYQSYLTAYPDNVDVRFEHATFLYDQGNWVSENGNPNDAIPFWRGSLKLFEHVLRLAEDRKDIRQKFVDILFELKDYPTALEHIQRLGNFPKTREDLEKLFNRYDLYDRAFVEGVIKGKQGQNLGFEYFLDYDKNTVSEKQLLTFLGDDFWMIIENSDLLNKLGQCHLYLNNLDAATKCFKKSILTSPSNIESYEFLIKILRSQDESDDAEDWLTEVVKANPNAFRSYLIRGEDRLHRTRTVNYEHVSKMLVNAEWDVLRAIQNAIQQLLESSYSTIPDSEVAKTLQQDFDAAANLAPAIGKPVEKAYRDALMKAVAHVKPVAEQIKKHLSQKTKKDEKPASPEVSRSTLAIIDQSLEGCRDGLLLAVACETQRAVLDKENAKQHQQTARDMAHAVLDIFPDDDKVYLTLSRIELQAGNIDEMIKWMASGARKAKENTLILWQLGSVLINTGRTEEARKILGELKKRGAKLKVILHLEAAFDIQKEDWSAAVLKLEKVRPEFVLEPEELRKIDVLLAKCYGKLDRVEDQRKAYARASAFDRSWRPALIGLAKSRIESGLLEEAIKDYQIILRFPNVKPKRYQEYAKLLLMTEKKKPRLQRNYQRVEEAIRHAKTATSNALPTQMLEAEFLLTKGDTSKARTLLLDMYNQLDGIKQK
ncbi:MAG: hypothetical protein PVH19_05785, partial [Planctomycetia bacterium]